MLAVRLAVPEDSENIVKIFRSSFPRKLLSSTIFGCTGIREFLRDTIRTQTAGTSVFFVSEDRDAVLGFCELRRMPNSLLLNHIYLLPEARGRGLGRSLLREGIGLARDQRQRFLSLDVFTDNLVAKKWYESLGLVLQAVQVWINVPLTPVDGEKEHWWTVSGLPEADRIHDIYGFSCFTLQTQSGNYGIGRLGTTLFRSTTVDILDDSSALVALFTLDCNRRLLCIGNGRNGNKAHTDNNAIIARSQRLAGDLDSVLGMLAPATSTSRGIA